MKSKDHARQLLRVGTLYTITFPAPRLARSSSSVEMPVLIHRPGSVAAVEGTARPGSRSGSIVGGPVSGMVHRPSLAENVRMASTNSFSSTGSAAGLGAGVAEDKPIAAGNGVSYQ